MTLQQKYRDSKGSKCSRITRVSKQSKYNISQKYITIKLKDVGKYTRTASVNEPKGLKIKYVDEERINL